MEIKVKYSSIDGYHKYATFKTLKGAQKFAHKWVGKHPDLGGYYAVSYDGIGKIEVSGDATLKDLFPDHNEKISGTVITKNCECCGHHEVGIENDAGEFIPLKSGMKIQIEEV